MQSRLPRPWQSASASSNVAALPSTLESIGASPLFPWTALQIESRLLGAVETAGGGPGTLPQIVRDAFFYVNGKLGLAAQVFVKGARPWV